MGRGGARPSNLRLICFTAKRLDFISISYRTTARSRNTQKDGACSIVLRVRARLRLHVRALARVRWLASKQTQKALRPREKMRNAINCECNGLSRMFFSFCEAPTQ